MKRRRLSPRKTPRQERSRATVEALLEATADILIRDGYAKLTTNRIAARAGVNIASLYQYFPGKEAIVAELRRRHGAEERSALKQVLAARTAGDLESTIRKLVSIGVAGHAHAPRLHQVFTEEMPALGYREVEAIDAPIFDAMRRFLQEEAGDVRDTDLALWMIATASGAVLHRAAVERPEDLSSGVIAEELTTLLCHYLRRDMCKTIKQRVKFKADPATVYQLLANSRKHSAMTGRRAVISTKVGGAFSINESEVTGVNVDLVAGQRIVQAWRHRRFPEGIFSMVAITLKRTPDGGTELVLVHRGVPKDLIPQTEQAWRDQYWHRMKTYLDQLQ